MAATPLTVLRSSSPYGSAPSAGAEVAADTANGNSFINDGQTHLLARNSDAQARTVTVGGKTFTLPAGETLVLGPFPVREQYGGTVTVTASNALVKLVAASLSSTDSAKR